MKNRTTGTLARAKITGIIPVGFWPQCLRPFEGELEGLFVGGCVERGVGSRFRAKAHAHFEGEHQGWICVLAMRRLLCTELLLHEVAHVLTGLGHVDKWRVKLIEIGGTLDPVMEADGRTVLLKSYQKRRRG